MLMQTLLRHSDEEIMKLPSGNAVMVPRATPAFYRWHLDEGWWAAMVISWAMAFCL